MASSSCLQSLERARPQLRRWRSYFRTLNCRPTRTGNLSLMSMLMDWSSQWRWRLTPSVKSPILTFTMLTRTNLSACLLITSLWFLPKCPPSPQLVNSEPSIGLPHSSLPSFGEPEVRIFDRRQLTTIEFQFPANPTGQAVKIVAYAQLIAAKYRGEIEPPTIFDGGEQAEIDLQIKFDDLNGHIDALNDIRDHLDDFGVRSSYVGALQHIDPSYRFSKHMLRNLGLVIR